MSDAVHEELVRSGALAPVPLDGSEERAWLDCDLASLAENRLGDRTDPRDLDDARRADWRERATLDLPMSIHERGDFERCYWIVDGGERAGTMALSIDPVGGRRLRVSSLYVLPSHRGRGVGQRAMRRAKEALGRHGLGMRLETSWPWQRTVRFYVALGMWVYMWKRDLTFCWDAETPAPQIEIGDETAILTVPRGGDRVTLLRAARRGDALELDDRTRDDMKGIGEASWHATSTLALALALRGWPLVRSAGEWEASRHSDGGSPEALAYKISLWEAWDRKQGWNVEAPRIPGLAYPTWDELEARWEAELGALDLGGGHAGA